MENQFQSYRYYQCRRKRKRIYYSRCSCRCWGCYESEVFKQDHSPSVSPARVINDPVEYNRIAEAKKQVFIDQGWYIKGQIKTGPHSNKYVNHIYLQGERYIDKRYSYIPLHFMCQMAKEKKSEFNTSSVEFKFQIPQKAGQNGTHLLSYVKSKLQKYIDDTKNMSAFERNKVSYKKYLDFENEKNSSIIMYTGLLQEKWGMGQEKTEEEKS